VYAILVREPFSEWSFHSAILNLQHKTKVMADNIMVFYEYRYVCEGQKAQWEAKKLARPKTHDRTNVPLRDCDSRLDWRRIFSFAQTTIV
jgi:hypothetical protein